MQSRLFTATLIALCLGGCNVYRAATGTATDAPVSNLWRQVATDPDRERLRTWHNAWDKALPKARAADPKTIDANAALFDPDKSLRDADIPPGDYRCRTFKLGAVGTAAKDFAVLPWGQCHVTAEGAVSGLYKQGGIQRPTGLIFHDTMMRSIFLGTLVLGDETSPLRYGTDDTRDMIGYIERIGDKHWRWVLPSPKFESLLDIIEIVPA